MAINAFGPAGSATALVISLSSVIQVQSAAWYVKFINRVFGAATAKAPVKMAG